MSLIYSKSCILMIFIFSKKMSKIKDFHSKSHPSYHNTPQTWYHLVENFPLFHMTSNLLQSDASIKFYLWNFKFSPNGGHFGRHLGFGGFRNKIFEVDLWNMICYVISLKISMVYLVCTMSGTQRHFWAFGPRLIGVLGTEPPKAPKI